MEISIKAGWIIIWILIFGILVLLYALFVKLPKHKINIKQQQTLMITGASLPDSFVYYASKRDMFMDSALHYSQLMNNLKK